MDLVRNTVTGLKLGSAVLPAISDTILHAITNAYNGLPAFKTLGDTIANLLDPSAMSRKQSRAFASQLWFEADAMIDSAHSAARFGDITGHKMSKKFASGVLKASGMDAWTVIQKRSFHVGFMGGLSNRIDKMQPTLDRYGFSPEDIEIISNSKRIQHKGASFVDPKELPQDLAERVVGMVSSESRYAVIEGDAYTSAIMHQGTRKGSVEGEALRLAGQFKMFPVAMMANHWNRMAQGRGSISRGAYFANFALGTTMMGAMVLQMKEISKGYTPQDMDSAEFWTKAIAQGGSGSLLFDIAAGDSRMYGGSLADFVGGPALGTVNQVLYESLLGSGDDLRRGERELKSYTAEAGRVVAGQIPSLWYTKAVMNRYILDEIKRATDPRYDVKRMAKERKRYRELGNERFF